MQAELSMAIVEKIFKTGSEKIHDECGMVAFLAAPVDFRCAQAVFKQLVEFGLVFYLRVLCLDLLEFNGDFMIV